MNWFNQNRFLGIFSAALGLATVLSVFFLLHGKGAAEEASTRLEATVTDLNRLRASAPFPSEENLRKMKALTDSYRSSLLALETDLKSRMFPRPALQPNEFQALLRQTATAVDDRARASKVQLPENFNLGFDEYATSLPNSLAAPRLGRQLRAIEYITNTVIDAHADALLSLTRSPLPEEKSVPAPTPASPGRPALKATSPEDALPIADWTSVDLTFVGSPAAARRFFNQIAAAKEQTYVIRTLQVKNQVDKGPKRGTSEEAPSATPLAGASSGSKTVEQGISFIVGTEHVNVATRIEIVRFRFPEKETR